MVAMGELRRNERYWRRKTKETMFLGHLKYPAVAVMGLEEGAGRGLKVGATRTGLGSTAMLVTFRCWPDSLCFA